MGLSDKKEPKIMSLKEFMRRRARAGVLIGMVYDLPDNKRKEGWRVYEKWLRGKITFSKAKRRLRELRND